jgi:hypothetical protein
MSFDDRSRSIDQARLCSRPRGGRLLKDFSDCSQVHFEPMACVPKNISKTAFM